MSIRLLNTADWHVDAQTNGVWSSKYGMNTTWVEAMRSVDQIVDICNDRKVDYLVIAGDLFNTGRPAAESVSQLTTRLSRMTQTKVVLLDGNHDQIGIVGEHCTPIEAYLSDQTWSAGYASNASVLDLDGLQLAMLPWHRVAGTSSLESTSSVLRDNVKRLADQIDGTSLLYGHLVLDELSFGPGGGVNPNRGSETLMSTSVLEATISLKELEDGPWSLVRSGHIHKRQSIYIGSIYKVDYGEADELKGVELVDIEEDGTCKTEFIPLVTRNLYSIDLTDSLVLVPELADEMKEGDLATFRLAHDAVIPTKLRDQFQHLRDKGVIVSSTVTPRPRDDKRLGDHGVSIGTSRRDAMRIYLSAKYEGDGDLVAGALRVFDDACDEYQELQGA